MLNERLERALEVLTENGQGHTGLRKQLEDYIGEPVEDDVLLFIQEAASAVKRTTDRKLMGQVAASERGEVANTVVFCAGLAIGKRLGIEDGERFAREVPQI